MDLKKIFIKDACPTKVGGQAVLEGVMMKGENRTAVALRLPDDSIRLKIEPNKAPSKWTKIPLVRGVFVFFSSLVRGMKIIMYSADELEAYEAEHGGEGGEPVEEGGLYGWVEKKFGEKAAWNMAMIFSVILALVFTIAVFIIAPTILVNWLKKITENEWILNFVEGFLRILLFVGYVVAIAKMPDIKRVFQYHGAEHKTIHCFENGMELTPENAITFERLHPRCGTSFLVFVMFVSWILFSFLGWPDLLWRVTSRVILLPVVAGLSYELLRWAGRSDNIVVKILSVPGLLLQKITTADPDEKQLAVAICSMKAVLSDELPEGVHEMDETGLSLKEPEVEKEDAAEGEAEAAPDKEDETPAEGAAIL